MCEVLNSMKGACGLDINVSDGMYLHDGTVCNFSAILAVHITCSALSQTVLCKTPAAEAEINRYGGKLIVSLILHTTQIQHLKLSTTKEIKHHAQFQPEDTATCGHYSEETWNTKSQYLAQQEWSAEGVSTATNWDCTPSS